MLLTWCEIVPFSCPMTTVPTNFSVPLTFSRSHKGSAPGHSPSQFHDVTPYRPSGGTQLQALLRDRLVASPRIDLNDYSAKAVIDWVELKAQTPGYHHAINMQRRLAEILKEGGEDSSVFVGGPDRGKWHKGHQFILRIQKPTRRGLALLSRDLLSHQEVEALLQHATVTSTDTVISFDSGNGNETMTFTGITDASYLGVYVSIEVGTCYNW